MNNRKWTSAVAGVVLLISFPLFVVAGAIYTYYRPREYYSRATVEIRYATDSALSTITNAVAADPHHLVLKNIPRTDLYEIGVFDQNRETAAIEANQIADTFSRLANISLPSFRSGSDNAPLTPLVVKIWERAEPAFAPARPNVFRNMALFAGLGSLLAVGGGMLLITSLIRGRPRPAAAF
jgi:hypothetical protein